MCSESNSIQIRLKLPSHNFLIDLQLKLPSNGLTTISGHSGSGKTTLLRYIAGLIRPKESDLSVNNVVWHDEPTWVPPHLRPIGYVFQEPSLFPHLSVLKNILYGCPKIKKNIYSIEEISEILGISSLFGRKPYELSGGERQRVAIARALASEPSLLLMDEPLASLDANRKNDILPFIKRLRDDLALPILYVTHSDNEIAELSNHHIVLDNGKVAKGGMLS